MAAASKAGNLLGVVAVIEHSGRMIGAMVRQRPLFAAAGICAFVAFVLVAVHPVQTAGLTAARVVSNGDRTRPVIALTFDDGINPANCRRLLAILVEQHVPATFFPLSDAMRLDPAFWKLVAAAGYPVGNHTLTHPEMPTLTLLQQEAEIRNGRILAESILGRTELRVFRPPYGAYNENTLLAAAATGFPTVLLWDTSDRSTAPTWTISQLLAAAELGKDGSVLLMHCGPNVTPYLLPQVIDFYRSHGFTFVTVPQLLHVAWSAGTTRTVTPAEILNGLTPLPPMASGGPITGPNGYSPPPSEPPTPEPSSSPTAEPSGSPTQSASGAASAAASTVPTASVSAAPSSSVGIVEPAVVLGLVLAALAAVLLIGAIAFARRRSGT
jgi:peptidoglycan/xylan/chitin deacetylase (PgdA/CDA1 family)